MTRLLLCFALLCPAVARAAESVPFSDARNVATLVTESDSIAPGKTLTVGLRLRLAPGWHTYWRNPGDAGIPAELDWTLPEGAHAGQIAWPAPERLAEGDLVTHGYTGEVLLAVPVSGLRGPASIGLHAAWLSCEKICVPEEASLRLDLPAGDGAPGANAGLFRAAEMGLPRPAPWSATIAADGTLDVSGPELGSTSVRAATFFADMPDRIAAAAPQPLAVRQGGLRLGLRLAAGEPLENLPGVLRITDPSGQASAFAIEARPGTLPAAPAAPRLVATLALAFLGGLILNLMPCVFPVLAIKAAGLAGLGAEARGRARAQAAAYTLGVVLSFCAIGGVLLALRAGGGVAGWGFQFAEPAFVAATAWLLFAIGLNFSGVFGLDALGFSGAGDSLARRGGAVGSFFTGALAVLVATPCTAPFMGAALAVALAGDAATAVAVFAVMGLGLAAPYALLAALPGAARLLPRPGAWMEVLRQALAFPMYGAAVWLLWVVGQEAGPDGVAATAAAGVGIAFALWLFGRARRPRLRLAAAAVLLAALLAGERMLALGASPAAGASLAGAEPFSAARLAELRGQGRPVFVDMSAAWCVTCLVNERVALDRDAVRAALAAGHIALLRGDWTRQDTAITAFLRAHGRDGVPLYVLYPAGDRPEVVLPQILTEGLVLDALRAAAAPDVMVGAAQ